MRLSLYRSVGLCQRRCARSPMMNSVLIRSSKFVRPSVRFNVGLEGMAMELVVEEGQVLEQQEH